MPEPWNNFPKKAIIPHANQCDYTFFNVPASVFSSRVIDFQINNFMQLIPLSPCGRGSGWGGFHASGLWRWPGTWHSVRRAVERFSCPIVWIKPSMMPSRLRKHGLFARCFLLDTGCLFILEQGIHPARQCRTTECIHHMVCMAMAGGDAVWLHHAWRGSLNNLE